MKKFISAEAFNQSHADMIKEVNCLGFAFGQTTPGNYILWRSTDPDTGRPFAGDTPVNAFIQKAEELGFKIRQVTDESKLDGKTGFILYGWYQYRDFWGNVFHNDFHVIRKNEDGTVEHKPDGREPACSTTIEEIEKEYFEKDRRFMFVLEE